ncbi:MAG: NYN domain-containing protein [Pseudomonadota bacterium]|uniref:LabA-like NYN domain-containing protein n=1 Tax=Thermithiobacillus tepidarius TaxID=929 RepID=UPI000402D599|nr:NYN domain-containing protein [Thermithiobacillus tepidarius]
MPNSSGPTRLGVYVDAENIKCNGGFSLRYDVLRRFAAREQAKLLRLNTYLAVDQQRGREDPEYGERIRGYQQAVRDSGWKIIEKPVRWYQNEDGTWISKANADLDLAVDAMLQSDRLDQVLLVTGDGDFLQVVKALQNKGCRVELLAFKNVSRALQHEVDAFYSGYLIPGLLPMRDARIPWGELGSRVRGVCTSWEGSRGFGFLRFLKDITAEMWITDSRNPESPYQTAFLHHSDLPGHLDPADLPSRDIIFEFDLEPSEREKGGFVARRCAVVHRYDGKGDSRGERNGTDAAERGQENAGKPTAV